MRRINLKLLVCIIMLMGITATAALSQDENTYQESPMLAARVANGELPPVEQRLPESPLIVEPFDEIGTYGGELRYAGSVDDVVTFISWEFLTRWEADMSGVYPNILESYDVNDDASVYTFHLRPGMRWSDGMPFTADDITFAINDLFLNPEVFPNPPANLIFNDEPVVVEKIDDYTVTFTFAGSYGMFPETLAWWPAWQSTFFPKHWLQQYHIDYDPENVEYMLNHIEDYPELVNSIAPIDSWDDIMRTYALTNPWAYLLFDYQLTRPTLFAWIATERDTENGTMTLERNPYYWKVDTAGNQLPYIDRIVLSIFNGNDEIKLLGLLSGQFDTAKDPPQEDYNLFADSQFTSGLALYNVPSDGAGLVSISFNMTVADEQKAAIFSNIDFRIGVSHAINRQQIITLVYDGIGIPRQIAPLPSSPLYNEQLENQYIEFNPALANEYLDRVLPDKDADGYRLMPDGNRLVVNFVIVDQFGIGIPQVAELISQQLNAVGIEVTIENTGSIINYTNENMLEATIYTGEGGSGITAILDPRWYVPTSVDSSHYARAWAVWYTNPADAQAIEPPDIVKEQMQLYEQVIATPDPDERIELMRQVLQIAADQFYVIGIASPPDRYWLINENIRNLPELWYDGWIPGMQAATNPFQWYFAQ